MRVVVLGAGIIGVATAYHLLRDGHEVAVVDRQPDAGLETSWGNGAILHPSSVQPWAAPGVPLQILRWLGRIDAPLLLRPQALPSMWRWGLGFLRNCARARHEASARHNLALALESLEAMAAIRSITEVAYDRATDSVLKTFATTKALDAALKAHRRLEPFGLVVERLDTAACVAREPALAEAAAGGRLAGGLFLPQDELGDCPKFCQGLARWCAGQGASFHFATTIETIETSHGAVRAVRTSAGTLPAEAVVVALGAWTPLLLRKLGLDAPIYPVKGISLTVPRAAWNDAPRHAILDDDGHFALVPIGDDRLRIAGTAEITGYDTTPDPARINAVVDRVTETFPAFRRCAKSPGARAWAGLRPVTPSGRPLIGPTLLKGLWINSGHGHTGWTTGAGSGRRLADMLAGRRAIPTSMTLGG